MKSINSESLVFISWAGQTSKECANYLYNRKRVERFIDRTALFSENYLICSHNQTLKMIYHIINRIDITLNSWRSLNFENGEVYEIENDKWRKI